MQAWHDGGPPISRTVVPFKRNDTSEEMTKYEIELHPIFITILLSDETSGGEARPFQQQYPVSRHLTLQSLLDDLCTSLDIESSRARLWLPVSRMRGFTGATDFILDLNYSLIDELVENKIISNESEVSLRKFEVVLELKDDNDSWPTEQKETNEMSEDLNQDQDTDSNPLSIS